MNWEAKLDALIEETMAMAKAANGETTKPVVPLPLVENDFARQPHRSTPIDPMVWPTSERDQIKQRVSNFKARQEQMRQEREDFFTRTMTRVRELAKGRSMDGQKF